MSCVLARCLTAAIFVLFLAAPAFAQERDQVNRDLRDGLHRVSEVVGGYRPRSVVAGFLAADSLRYLAETD